MRRFVALLVPLLLTSSFVPGAPHARADEPVKVTDVYITVDDGVRLAADVYLPAGTPTDGSAQVPCLVELTPYRKEGRAAEGVSVLPDNGFGLIEVDARGTGGSEGEYDIVFSLREQWDTATVIDWAAEESGWCTERVGMFGGSYSGIIQYLTASLPAERAPRHLAAIAPQRAYGDLYRDIVYHGGQVIGSFGAIWSSAATAFYTQPPTNVDTNAGQGAWLDHLTGNDPLIATFLSNPYADAVYTDSGPDAWGSQKLYDDSSILPRIENLRVPTLHLAGWFDAFTRGQLLTFQRALEAERSLGDRGPNHLIVGPWNHGGTHFVNPPHFTERLLDWYRYWLADGPRPAWFDGPRISYYVMGEGTMDDTTGEWRTADTWPLPDADYTRFYLHGPQGRLPGGRLSPTPPESLGVSVYDYNPTQGTSEAGSRWDNAAIVPQSNIDQRTDEPKGLTFTTDALATDTAVAGPIVLKLWAATAGVPGNPDLANIWPGAAQLTPPYHDTDFVVKLTDVAPDGTSTLITAGYLRASHRAVDVSRSVVVGDEIVSPYHPHTLAALDPPGIAETRDYLIEVWPTAKTFLRGHRIRITLYSADTPNHLNLLKPARNQILHGPERESYLLLPLVEAP